MPRSLSWYHDMWANTLLESMQMRHFCVTGTFHQAFNRTVWDLFVFFFSKCGFFAKLTCCEFTVGPPRFSINYNPVNGVSICEEKKEGCCHLCEPRQYIQPRLASYDWGKCGPDTLPFTGRQRLHYANVTTRGKESEWASRREREREGRKANKQESVKKRGASRKRGRAPRRESERAEPHSLYMRGRTCCHLPHLNAPPKTPRSLFSTRHLNWVRQVLEDRFRCICKDTETVSEWYKRAHGEPFCSWYLRFSGWYGFYLSTRVAFQIGQHIHFPFFFTLTLTSAQISHTLLMKPCMGEWIALQFNNGTGRRSQSQIAAVSTFMKCLLYPGSFFLRD